MGLLYHMGFCRWPESEKPAEMRSFFVLSAEHHFSHAERDLKRRRASLALYRLSWRLLLFGFHSPREAKQGTGGEMSTNRNKNLILVLLPKVAIFAILIAELRTGSALSALSRAQLNQS